MCCPKRDAGPKKRNPCGEVFSEQPFCSNPSTLTFLSSIKHHCRKKKNLREIQSRQLQFETGEKGIIHNVQSGLVAYLYHQYKYSQSSRLL
jgi:hypothetical protein